MNSTPSLSYSSQWSLTACLVLESPPPPPRPHDLLYWWWWVFSFMNPKLSINNPVRFLSGSRCWSQFNTVHQNSLRIFVLQMNTWKSYPCSTTSLLMPRPIYLFCLKMIERGTRSVTGKVHVSNPRLAYSHHHIETPMPPSKSAHRKALLQCRNSQHSQSHIYPWWLALMEYFCGRFCFNLHTYSPAGTVACFMYEMN